MSVAQRATSSAQYLRPCNWLVGLEIKGNIAVNRTDGMVPTHDGLNSSGLVSVEYERTFLLSASDSPRETGCETVTTGPSHARDAFERGTALKRAGLFKQAALHFEQAAQHPAYAVKGLAQMGLCFKTCGKKEEAVAAFQRAVQVSSGFSKEKVPILYLLGKTLESLARTSDALETYRWIRREIPGYRDVGDRIERLSSRRASTGLGTPPAALSGSWADDLLKTCRGLLRPHK